MRMERCRGAAFFRHDVGRGRERTRWAEDRPEGQFYVSRPSGLWIISLEGKHLGTLTGPEHPPNFAWGDDGKTLEQINATAHRSLDSEWEVSSNSQRCRA